MRKHIAAFALLIFITMTACADASHRETPVVRAVKKIEKSVVNIRTEKIITRRSPFGDEHFFGDSFFNDFFGFNRTYKSQSLGSGVLVKSDGTIITNYHVIEGASKVIVLLSDEQSYEAEVIGGDKILDLAILKIKNSDKKFPTAIIGTSKDIMLGETVIAMGNPYGLSSSLTTGVVSSTTRVINVGSGYSVFMQTDALINPGNSGGPLVNLDGEVIGINTAIFKEAQGIGFSIPIDTAMRVMPEILKRGKIRMGYMGFTVEQQVDKDNTPKLVVTRVERKSNARYIGIQKGDEIISIAGIPVSSLQAMSNMLRSYPPGSNVSIAIIRGSKNLKGKIAISDYPKDYGIRVLKNNYGLSFAKKGKFIAINRVDKRSYFQEGDIIIAVNDKEVKSLDVLDDLIVENLGQEVVVSLYRERGLIRIKIAL
jgi:serine protease Do